MHTRDAIARRLGIFAKANFNCGIGPGGFQPGNDCGAGAGGGSSDKPKAAPRKPSLGTAKGVEERARAAGRSVTEQYVHETRSRIAKDAERKQKQRDRRAGADLARIDTDLAEARQRRDELRARGPQGDTIADLDRRLAEVTERRDQARKEREAAAAANAASKARIEVLKRQLAESKARSRGLRI